MSKPSKTSTSLAVLALVASNLPGMAAADDLTILASDLPPHFMADGTGREAEVISTVMGRCGHNVTFEIQPFTRHWKTYDSGQGDGVTTVPPGMQLAGYQTDVHVQYQNGVSTLTANGENITDLSALAGQSVIAFKGAEDILPGLKEAVPSFKSYKEVADQITQSRMIFGQRVDAVIGDGMIFAEYNEQLRGEDDLPFDANQGVTFQATFEPSSYAMNFRNEAHAADFNRCLAEATADGTIDAINEKWAERYRETLGTQYLGH